MFDHQRIAPELPANQRMLVMERNGKLRPAMPHELPDADERRVLDAMRLGRLYELEREIDWQQNNMTGAGRIQG